ncbi:hypothetical protein I7V28_01290 [Lelliottia amnigena]|uniref:hypothetical protein n=1 Tax=Lelliottia amnigena TaxID=61646 RepID=UPI00192C19FD|nr:hypothetical protein [Lelliottia amnigena]MBL5919768.1 hypothetical protein [Lelliottia amnigena]
MNGVAWLSDYQTTVLSVLEQIPWAVTTGAYPDLPGDDFPTPAVFFNVARWERAETSLGGNITLSITGNFYILRHFVAGEGEDETVQGSAETRVRNAALKMSDWLEGRQFGPGTSPAVFDSAEPMVWDFGDGGSPYSIWSVSFTQLLAVGQDPFDDSGAPTLKEFWLGVFPEVGKDHKDDYILLAKSGESS